MRRTGFCGVMALAGLLFLGGCVAHYKTVSEERFSAAPELSHACRFQWTAEKAWFRADDHNRYGWTDAGTFGMPTLLRNLQDLTANCPGTGRTGAQARVSAHTLEFADQVNRKAMLVPVVFFQLFSFGYAPMEMTNFYAVCVESALPDEPRRAAIAQGKLDAVTNVWGASQSLLNPGDTLRQRNKEQLLRDLTRQAWHKLWTPGQGLASGAGCRESLDAFVK